MAGSGNGPGGSSVGVAPSGRRLALSDPLRLPAGEDLDTSWGEPAEAEEQRDRRYLSERPPHHGG